MGKELLKNINIQFVMKLLTFLMPVTVIVSIPFISGSQYFWFMFLITVIYNIYLISINFKNYLYKYKWEILFIVSCLVSVLLNFNYKNIYSIVSVIMTAILIFNFIIVYPKLTKEQMEFENYSIDYLLLIFTFIMGLLSIIIFINNPINIVKGERFIGAYSNSNQLGFWAFISFIISFKYLKNKIIIVNILLELVLIILAGSRSVFIATSFFVIYTLFKKVDFKSPKNIYVFLMSIVFFVLLIIITTFTRYQWLYKYIKDMEFKEILNTLSGYRYYIWKEVLEIFYKFPIFGIGPNNVNNAAKLVLAENSMLITGGWEDPHNIVIALLTYTGLIGTLLFIKILYDKFKVIIENKSDYLLISIICLLVISLFDIGIIFDNRVLSVYFWYLIGQVNLVRHENDKKD